MEKEISYNLLRKKKRRVRSAINSRPERRNVRMSYPRPTCRAVVFRADLVPRNVLALWREVIGLLTAQNPALVSTFLPRDERLVRACTIYSSLRMIIILSITLFAINLWKIAKAGVNDDFREQEESLSYTSNLCYMSRGFGFDYNATTKSIHWLIRRCDYLEPSNYRDDSIIQLWPYQFKRYSLLFSNRID